MSQERAKKAFNFLVNSYIYGDPKEYEKRPIPDFYRIAGASVAVDRL